MRSNLSPHSSSAKWAYNFWAPSRTFFLHSEVVYNDTYIVIGGHRNTGGGGGGAECDLNCWPKFRFELLGTCVSLTLASWPESCRIIGKIKKKHICQKPKITFAFGRLKKKFLLDFKYKVGRSILVNTTAFVVGFSISRCINQGKPNWKHFCKNLIKIF